MCLQNVLHFNHLTFFNLYLFNFFLFVIFFHILIHAVVNMSDLDIVYYFKGVDL